MFPESSSEHSKWMAVYYQKSEENPRVWIPVIIRVPKNFDSPKTSQKKFPVFNPFNQKFSPTVFANKFPKKKAEKEKKKNEKAKKEKKKKKEQEAKEKAKKEKEQEKEKKKEEEEAHKEQEHENNSNNKNLSTHNTNTKLFKDCEEGIEMYHASRGTNMALRMAL